MHVPRLILDKGISTRGICCCYNYMRTYRTRVAIGVDIYDTARIQERRWENQKKIHARKPTFFASLRFFVAFFDKIPHLTVYGINGIKNNNKSHLNVQKCVYSQSL